MLFYNIVGKEKEGSRGGVRLSEEKEREGDCQKHYTISKRCAAHRALIAGEGGVRVRKPRGEGPGELFKEGGLIYQDPRIEKKVDAALRW